MGTDHSVSEKVMKTNKIVVRQETSEQMEARLKREAENRERSRKAWDEITAEKVADVLEFGKPRIKYNGMTKSGRW